MSKTGWVILGINYEYNDEINYAQGLDGIASAVYTDKEAAIKELERLEHSMWCGLQLDHYSYGLEELGTPSVILPIINLIRINRNMELLLPDNLEYGDLTLPGDLSSEEINSLKELIGLSFYQLAEVTIE